MVVADSSCDVKFGDFGPRILGETLQSGVHDQRPTAVKV